MKADELRELTDTEIKEQLVLLREELFNLRFQKVTAQIQNPSRLRFVRRDIARILTLCREKEINPAELAEETPTPKRASRKKKASKED